MVNFLSSAPIYFIRSNTFLQQVIIIIISVISGGLSFFPKNLITTFLVFVGCMTFEWLQKGSRFIDEPERFESNKDAIVSTPTFLLIILVLKLTKIIK